MSLPTVSQENIKVEEGLANIYYLSMQTFISQTILQLSKMSNFQTMYDLVRV